MRRRRLLSQDSDFDPMSVVGNLFDIAMVFAVALMVALVTRYNMTEMFSTEDFTMVKNPGKENMETVSKKGQKIEHEAEYRSAFQYKSVSSICPFLYCFQMQRKGK